MKNLGAFLAVVALLAVGCGGNDRDGDDSNSAESAAIVQGDQEIADAAVLTLIDFPSGWRSEEPDDSEEVDPCPGFEKFIETGNADSRTFSQDDAEAENSVMLYGTEGEASKFFQLYQSDDALDCISDRFEDGVKEAAIDNRDVKVKDLQIGRLSVDPFGDETGAVQIELELESQGLNLSVYADIVLVRVGRAIALFTFFDVLSPFSGSRDELLQAVVDRLEAAL